MYITLVDSWWVVEGDSGAIRHWCKTLEEAQGIVAKSLTARIAREKARLATANGEGYTEIENTIAGLEAMLARLVKQGS